MRLQKLILKDFQGIRSLEFTPEGKDASIYGPNGSGKSTIANALSWLLFGKAADNESNYTPQTLDADGHEIHGLTHEAEAVFSLEDGSEITLKKSYHETYARGKAEDGTRKVNGHTTDRFVDGKGVTEKEYIDRIERIIDQKTGLMLSLPQFFAETMPWQERREMLLSIAGDVSDDEVIASDDSLKGLSARLGEGSSRVTVSAYREATADSIKKMKLEREMLLPREDEAARAIPDLAGIDEDDLKRQAEAARDERTRLTIELGNMSEDSAAVEARRALAEKETQLTEARKAYAEDCERKNHEAAEALKAAREAARDADRDADEAEDQARRTEDAISRKNEEKNRLSAKWSDVKAKLSGLSMEDVKEICPVCGQRFPESMINEAREKASNHLEKEKERLEEELKGIADKGTRMAAEISALEEEAGILRESSEKLRAAAVSRKAEAAAREKDIIRFPSFETTDGYASLSADIKTLKDALRGFGDTLDEARRTMKERIKAIDDEADRIQRKLQDFEKKREQEKRIKEIRARAKELKELIEDAEKGIELADSFIRRRAELLDQKVSSLFTGIRFRLYDTQVNGVIKELCEPLVETKSGWIPYTQASNAEKISGGLRIISMLSEHIGKEMPVVIDNAEAVIALPRIKSQTIRLAVSDEKTGSMRFEIG